MSVLGVILVRKFPAFSRIRTECEKFSPNAGKCGKNADQNNFEYEVSLYSVRMCENAGKIRTRITPNTDSFCAVDVLGYFCGSDHGKGVRNLQKLENLI